MWSERSWQEKRCLPPRKRHSTVECCCPLPCRASWSFKASLRGLTKLHNSCFIPLRFSNTSLPSAWNELSVFSEWCLWQPHYTTRSQELRLIRLWAHPKSQWAPESKTLCSAWRPVCLHCNYLDCTTAMVDKTHKHTQGIHHGENKQRCTPLSSNGL